MVAKPWKYAMVAAGAALVLLLAASCTRPQPGNQTAATTPAADSAAMAQQPAAKAMGGGPPSDVCVQGNATNRVEKVTLHRHDGTDQVIQPDGRVCGVIWDGGVTLRVPSHGGAQGVAADSTTLATTNVCQWIGDQWVCSPTLGPGQSAAPPGKK